MKTKVLILFILSICGLSYAQTPQSFNYQAVARDVSGAVIPNSNLGIRMSILDASDNIMYSESHAKLTNALGLFSLKVGQGTVIIGDMAFIDWSSGSFFLKVDVDYAGGTNYTTIGTTQILSVPYALHAETVSQNDDADADPENEIQALSIEGNELTISGGNTVNLPSSGGTGDGDSDPNNEIQDLGSTLSDTGVVVSISKGGMSTSFSINDADADSTNEIQALSKDGNMIMLSDGGSVEDAVDDADADATNEIQALSKDGNMIMLSNGGSVMDAVDDADADASNEIQDLSITGSTLSISNGNSVELPGGSDADADPANEIQSISKSGNVISLSKGGGMVTDAVDDADASPTNELQDLSLLALADAGVDGATVYQLELSNSGSVVDLPYNEWWQATFLLIDPPQIGNIYTNYPTVINNTLDAQTVVAPVIETTDITVGEPTTLATHIQAEGIHWDGGGLSDDLGFFLERDEIRYGVTLPSTDFQMKLNKRELQFVNGGGWQSTYLGGESTGILQLFPGGGTPAYLTTGLTSSGSGNLNINGSNGNLNIWNTHLSGVPNGGYLSVNDDGGVQQAGVYVDAAGQGIVWGDMKTFVMPHPNDKDKEIQYVSLEGPEAGAYERGTTQLINGEAIVEFSEHFRHVIGSENMTVMITPLSAESKGIAVIEKSENGFKVKELLKGNGTYEFDWEVKAIRAGYEDFEVVRKKLEIHDNTKDKRANSGKN